MCVFFMITGCMGAYWIRNCRERKVFVPAGAKTRPVGCRLAVAVDIFLGHYSWTGLVWSSAFAFLGGFRRRRGQLRRGPPGEIAFGYNHGHHPAGTRQPGPAVLRQLMIEAPGTYHHSVILGSMAEAAAAEIGANPLLAKVSGY